MLPAIVDRPAGGQVLMDALARFDRLPVIAAALGDSLPPTRPPAPAGHAGRHRRRRASCAIDGDACWLEMRGSGWVIRPQLVVTNAHVIAGEHDIAVQLSDGSWSAYPVYVDKDHDIAMLRVHGLDVPPLATHPLAAERPVALIGYPGGGPLTVAAAGRDAGDGAGRRTRTATAWAAHGGADPRDRCATATAAARWSTAGAGWWP